MPFFVSLYSFNKINFLENEEKFPLQLSSKMTESGPRTHQQFMTCDEHDPNKQLHVLKLQSQIKTETRSH